AFRDIHIAQLARDLDHVLHAAARDGDLALILGRDVHDLLDALDVRGEGSDDDALFAALEKLVELLRDLALGISVTRALDVRRVREQRQDALLAQLAQAREVYHLALDGRDVYLEVAGVDDGAYGRLDGQGHGVRDGVVHVYHLDLKAAELEPVARLLREDLRVVQQV